VQGGPRGVCRLDMCLILSAKYQIRNPVDKNNQTNRIEQDLLDKMLSLNRCNNCGYGFNQD
jgi:hypothetical protein